MADAAHTFLSCDKEICVSFTLANPKGWNLLLVHYNKRRKQPGGIRLLFCLNSCSRVVGAVHEVTQ